VAIGKPIRPDGHFALLSGHFALLSDQGDRDALENRPFQVSCKHFVVPSTMCPHAHLARSPVGLADKVWLEAVGREPGENSPWYRSHVLAQRPKLDSETLIPQEWLNLALSDATASAGLEDLAMHSCPGKMRGLEYQLRFSRTSRRPATPQTTDLSQSQVRGQNFLLAMVKAARS